MNEILNLIGNPYFWGMVAVYWTFSAAVGALEAPTEKSSAFYRWLFRFLNTLAANVARAFSSKIPGLKNGNGGNGGPAIAMVLLPLCLILVACQPFEKSARDSIAAAKGFIEQAQANHGDECRAECQLDSVQDKSKCRGICNSINRAIHAQNLAIDALNLYCAGADWQSGGKCQPNKEFAPRVRAALGNLDRIIKDEKGAVGK